MPAQHDHESHHHDHHADHKAEQRLELGAATGNIAVGVPGIAATFKDSLLTMAAGTLHNFSDGGIYLFQSYALRKLRHNQISERKLNVINKATQTLLCLGALSIAAKAGYDLQNDAHEHDNPTAWSYLTALGALGLSTALLASERIVSKRRKAARHGGEATARRHFHDHVLIDFAHAATEMGGVVMAGLGYAAIEKWTALGIGLAGAMHFNPLRRGHSHDHDHDHAHELSHRRAFSERFRLRRLRLAGAAALTTALAITAGTSVESQEQRSSPPPIAQKATDRNQSIQPIPKQDSEVATKTAPSPRAFKIKAGTTLTHIYRRLGIPSDQHHHVTARIQTALYKEEVAYRAHDGPRLNEGAVFSQQIIAELAKIRS